MKTGKTAGALGQDGFPGESAIRAYARTSGLEARCVVFGAGVIGGPAYFIFLGKALLDGRANPDSRFLAVGDTEAEAWAKAYGWLREQDWAKDGLAIASDILCAEVRMPAGITGES